MAQGGVFSLLLGDARFDALFQASDSLRARLAAIRAARAAAGRPDPAPTPADVAQTHLLYVGAAFRPHAAVASEYVRVRPSGDGGGALGAGGGTCEFVLPTAGAFTSDAFVHVRLRPVGAEGATAPGPGVPYLRYCALPGARLFRRVSLHAAGTLIDDYGPDEVAAHGKFFVGPEAQAAWERCLGQQALREASYLAGGRSASLFYREGAQTPKLRHGAYDLLVPLQFWFCRGPEQAILNSDEGPASQRKVTVELAPLADLLYAYQPDPADPGRLVPAPLPVARLAFEASLYVNCLFVNPEVRDTFAARAGFSLVRVHRRQVTPLPSAAGSVLLDRLRFPAEFLLAGVRARALAADPDRWWLMGAPPAGGAAAALRAPALEWNAALGLAELVGREAADVTALEPAVEALGFTAHGIEIFPELPAAFYGAYLPLRYAPGAVRAPADPGALLVSFCLFPGRFSPSGYYNLSAGRELHATYRLREEVAAAYEPGSYELVVLLKALNFLLRKGDRLAIRYSV